MRTTVPKHPRVRRLRVVCQPSLGGDLVAFLTGERLARVATARPPILLFASTPFLLRPWAAGRIASWTTVKRLIPFRNRLRPMDRGRLYGIGYGRYQISLHRSTWKPFGRHAHGEGEQSRRTCSHRASKHFGDLILKISSEQPRDNSSRRRAASSRFAGGTVEKVLDHGWPENDAELAAWLDKINAANGWRC